MNNFSEINTELKRAVEKINELNDKIKRLEERKKRLNNIKTIYYDIFSSKL